MTTAPAAQNWSVAGILISGLVMMARRAVLAAVAVLPGPAGERPGLTGAARLTAGRRPSGHDPPGRSSYARPMFCQLVRAAIRSGSDGARVALQRSTVSSRTVAASPLRPTLR